MFCSGEPLRDLGRNLPCSRGVSPLFQLFKCPPRCWPARSVGLFYSAVASATAHLPEGTWMFSAVSAATSASGNGLCPSTPLPLRSFC